MPSRAALGAAQRGPARHGKARGLLGLSPGAHFMPEKPVTFAADICNKKHE
jgi:hypothetical protein